MLLTKAEHGLGAATLLAEHGYNNSAVSEAYYVMFYAAKALLSGKGLMHSRHSAVLSAFGLPEIIKDVIDCNCSTRSK